MRLTKQTDYAVRTMMYCAIRGENLSRVADIAHAYSISELFLFKIIKPLVVGGLVKSIRGRNGGIMLARSASTITLAETMKLTEDSFALAECFEPANSDCPLIGHCTYNVALTQALSAFFDVLEGITIADLIGKPHTVAPLLGLNAETSALAHHQVS